MRIAFLSEGKLFLKEPGQTTVEIESPFAREALERSSTRNQRNAWKAAGAGDENMYSARTVWGRQAMPDATGAPVFRHIARGAKPGELIYTLVMSASAGLFQINLETRDETRLFHRQDFDPCGLACHPATGEILLASRDKDDLGKLEILEGEARRRRQLTSGDGHDSHPAFDPAQPGIAVFESTGVARDEAGQIIGYGPTGLCAFDRQRGEVKSLLEDERSDYLSPRFAPDGQLHFIHRPTLAGQGLSLGARVKAFVLLPYHLAGAAFGFLDAFSRLFGKRPLRPDPAGPVLPQPRQRMATFQGLRVDLERALAKKGKATDSVQLVPRDWELLRYHTDGTVETIARHVVAFDIGPNGAIVYSDGLRIWEHGEPPRKLAEGHIIQAIAIV